MSQGRWFRYYEEALNDPKVQKLTGDLFKAWVNLLCLASRSGGSIPSLSDVAFALRVPESKAAIIMTELSSAGLFDAVPGNYFEPHNWCSRQYKSDVSTDRVKRFRKRFTSVSETENETPPEQSRAEAETDKKDSCAIEEKFDQFFKVYPKRKGANPREPARKTFFAFVEWGVDPDAIIAGARQCAIVDVDKVGTPYIPHAAKWLLNRSWQDYPAENVVPITRKGVYVDFTDPAREAWDAYGQSVGKSYPVDKHGGWEFPTHWPPGYQQRQGKMS